MNWDVILKDADKVIVIAVSKDDNMSIAFNEKLDEMDVLDYLSAATTYFYMTASDRGDETLQ